MENGLHIVVVEEASLSRNVLLKALRHWGHVCALAETEGSAWDEVLAAPPHAVVLVDWHCDFLDCVEFFERIRRKPTLHSAYLLGGIPRGAVGAIRRCILSGADDYVWRPYDLDEMQVRLHVAAKLMGLRSNAPVFIS